jgi:hypothetical protein
MADHKKLTGGNVASRIGTTVSTQNRTTIPHIASQEEQMNHTVIPGNAQLKSLKILVNLGVMNNWTNTVTPVKTASKANE